MTATLLTQNPTFHALTGTQKVGRRQISVATDYAGAVTVLYRAAEEYWVVTTRNARNAFTTDSESGTNAAIWRDRAEGRYVIDYVDSYGVRVEAGRTRGLGAAIGVASSTTTHMWAESR